MEEKDLKAYFTRIGVNFECGNVEPNFLTLKTLQLAHLQHIPFENLDVVHGRKISMDVPDIVKKLIYQRRGGYCFEQNTLFQEVLKLIGFEVTPLISRIRWNKPPGILTPYTHIVLEVKTPNSVRYLVDVGFGGLGSSVPLRFDTEEPQETDSIYRLLQVTSTTTISINNTDISGSKLSATCAANSNNSNSQCDSATMVQIYLTEKWVDMMLIRMEATPLVDQQQINWFCCTYPTAMWVTRLFVARMIDGSERHHILNNQYVIRHASGEVTRTVITSVHHLLSLLDTVFGIDLSLLEATGSSDGFNCSFKESCTKWLTLPVPL